MEKMVHTKDGRELEMNGIFVWIVANMTLVFRLSRCKLNFYNANIHIEIVSKPLLKVTWTWGINIISYSCSPLVLSVARNYLCEWLFLPRKINGDGFATLAFVLLMTTWRLRSEVFLLEVGRPRCEFTIVVRRYVVEGLKFVAERREQVRT